MLPTRAFETVAAVFAPDRGEDPYRCVTCGSGFEIQYHVCPDCGGFGVDPVEE